ncbi:MAG: response regulator [Fischerella sp.]|uniref:response regulator n=1 Tax=Fischerella sp. TaxID=1191 RepID=UPI00185B92E5|nr:response regulator [Fischerella sp.]NWF58031.1 response regulator [Fischerella sp.]
MNNASVPIYQTPSLNGLRVLIVDNNPDCVELIRVILQEFSILVKVATSAREALEVLANWQVDVLISEIAMPSEDGYSLIRKIRIVEERQNLKLLPAIALTASVTEKVCDEALSSGFQVYAEKPIEPDELVANVTYLARTIEEMALAS